MAPEPHRVGYPVLYGVAYPVLSSANYTTWAIKTEAILKAQGLWDIVNPAGGGAVDPEKDKEDKVEKDKKDKEDKVEKDKKDKVAMAELFLALPEDILWQVSQKNTAKEVWYSLKARFVGDGRVKAARLSTLKDEFEVLLMKEGESLDDYAGKIVGMAARFHNLDAKLHNKDMVKKLLDTVPEKLYPVVAGIEQHHDVEKISFEKALGYLNAFDERSRRRTQPRKTGDGQLLLTAAEWQAQEKLKSPAWKANRAEKMEKENLRNPSPLPRSQVGMGAEEDAAARPEFLPSTATATGTATGTATTTATAPSATATTTVTVTATPTATDQQ